MPFTPLHMGPGLFFKATIYRPFSLIVFGFCQILIDLEPLYFMMIGELPLHRFFHTLPGASIVALLGVVVGKPMGEALLKAWNRDQPQHQSRLTIAPVIPLRAAILGAFLGTYSHLFFDSFVHTDFNPLAPFFAAPEIMGSIRMDDMAQFCLFAAGIGLVGLALRLAWQIIQKRKNNRSVTDLK